MNLYCIGECYYEESLRDASGLFSLSEEDLENDDIVRPDDLCIFKIIINMGKKDKTVSIDIKIQTLKQNLLPEPSFEHAFLRQTWQS